MWSNWNPHTLLVGISSGILTLENMLTAFYFLNKFTLFLAVLGLHCCEWAFSSCGEQASHCGGFSCCRARALGVRASVVAACGLSSCGTQA